MIKKQLGEIDFTKSAVEIERLIRGLDPWPSAYTHLGDKTLKIWKASVIEQENADGRATDAALSADASAEAVTSQPGTVISVSRDSLIVRTGQGALSLKEVQLEGKKRMDIASFLRGCPVEVGTILANG